MAFVQESGNLILDIINLFIILIACGMIVYLFYSYSDLRSKIEDLQKNTPS
jgi:hypothetical protein